jgi:phosphohistidine swiveling domain-containing protein
MIYPLTQLSDSGDPSLGSEISALVTLKNANVDVTDTVVITTELFDRFVGTDEVAEEYIHQLTRILADCQIGTSAEMFLQVSLTNDCAGIVTNIKIQNNYTSLKWNLQRVYRSWFSERARAFRITYWRPDEERAPAIFIQPYYEDVHSLDTRSPMTGEQTVADNYSNNVDNKIDEFQDHYTDWLKHIERTLKHPCKVYFEPVHEQICKVKKQTMSDSATWCAIDELFDTAVIGPLDYLRLVKPQMISISAGYDYAISADVLQATGLPGSAGVAKGQLFFRTSTIPEGNNASYILAATDYSPDDFESLELCSGAIQLHGGLNSHVSVIGRGMGKPVVVGLPALKIDEGKRILYCSGKPIGEFSDVIVDGTLGKVVFSKEASVTPKYAISEALPEHLRRLWSALHFFDNDGSFKILALDDQLHLAELRQSLRKIEHR